MDPKMLLGTLSTASYAKAHISTLERNARAVAVPADPSFALRANLVEGSLYSQQANLTVDDDALLLSVVAGRPGHFATPGDGLRRSSQKAVTTNPASASTTAPWMRRMSYDEYSGSTMAKRQTLTPLKQDVAMRRAQQRQNDPKIKERKQRALMQSFDAARRRPIQHPDLRKSHLKPVSIAPIFPDFANLGEDFIALEFEKDTLLTHSDRVQNDPELAEDAIRTTATISVAEGTSGKKHIACYTPTERTLQKRKRVKEDEDGPSPSEKEKKMVRFVKDEEYDWVQEYAIREGQFGTDGTDGPSRSCYAVTEYVSEDSQTRIACFSRIATSWKLSRRPGTMPRLGKPSLKMERSLDPPNEHNLKLKRDIITGVSQAKIRANKEKHRMAAMLEEDD